MKMNNARMTLVTRWRFAADGVIAPPETAIGEEFHSISGQDDLMENPTDEQTYAADNDDGIASHPPPGIRALPPTHSEIGEGIIDGPGIGPQRWGLMDPDASNVDQLAESYTVHGVVGLVIF